MDYRYKIITLPFVQISKPTQQTKKWNIKNGKFQYTTDILLKRNKETK